MITLRCLRRASQRWPLHDLPRSRQYGSLVAHKRHGRQRLFLAGLNPFLPSTARNAVSPSFTEVPLHEWIGSLGVDVEPGQAEITHIAAGHSHLLLSYKIDDTENVFAIGRNESGQLAIGYNSQEPTRGLVEGFSGDYIEQLACGITSSYIRVRQGDKSVVYACGSTYRGQLGIPPATVSGQRFVTRATQTSGEADIARLAVGFESCLALTTDGTLLATGVNTDGQLGTGDDVDRHMYASVSLSDVVARSDLKSVHMGADTSALLTKDGRLWTFGNSEYAQAMHGEKIDRVMRARVVEAEVFDKTKIVDFSCAGSASLALTDGGSLFSAGFGATGRGLEHLESLQVHPIHTQSPIRAIAGGYGCFAATTRTEEVILFGLNGKFGRLGTSQHANVLAPKTVTFRSLRKPVDRIEAIAIGANSVYVLLREND